MQYSAADIHQLTKNVSQLTEALLISERRYQHLFRWMMTLFILFLLTVGYLSFEAIAQAQARDIGKTITSAEEATIAMAQILQQVAKDMQTTEFKKTVTSLGHLIRTADHLSREQELGKTLKDLSELIQGIDSLFQLPETQATLADLSTLIRRIRQDSDQLRKILESDEGSGLLTYSQIQDIEDVLRLLHYDLKAIPFMAEDMRQMNIKMGIMARDVDSTMGRAGRMMPWW